MDKQWQREGIRKVLRKEGNDLARLQELKAEVIEEKKTEHVDDGGLTEIMLEELDTRIQELSV